MLPLLQVTPLSSNVSVVPYPIPPAGADLASWQPDEEPPPLTFSVQLSQQLLVPASVRVGWWDSKQAAWSEEGIT
jgi:cancer susceptibility candidate protein 1